jgi:hypothetical protein
VFWHAPGCPNSEKQWVDGQWHDQVKYTLTITVTGNVIHCRQNIAAVMIDLLADLVRRDPSPPSPSFFDCSSGEWDELTKTGWDTKLEVPDV